MSKEDISSIEVGKRIRHIRMELGLSMTRFAQKIDNKAKSGTISNWETGKNLPNNERIKRIAELGNVSIEYLLYGFDDSESQLRVKTYSIGETIKKIRLRLNLSQEDFGKLFDPPVKKQTVSNWENSYSLPSTHRLQYIADLETDKDMPDIDITINDLIGAIESTRLTEKIDVIISSILDNYETAQNKTDIRIKVIQKTHQFLDIHKDQEFSTALLKKQIMKFIEDTIDDLEKNSKYYPKNNENAILYVHDLLSNVLDKVDLYYKADYWADDDVPHPLTKDYLLTKLDYEQYQEITSCIQNIMNKFEL